MRNAAHTSIKVTSPHTLPHWRHPKLPMVKGTQICATSYSTTLTCSGGEYSPWSTLCQTVVISLVEQTTLKQSSGSWPPPAPELPPCTLGKLQDMLAASAFPPPQLETYSNLSEMVWSAQEPATAH